MSVWTVCLCWSHLIYLYGQSASVEAIWFTCMDSLPLLTSFDLLVWTVCLCWNHLIYLYGQSASVEVIWFTCMDSLPLLKPFDLLVWTVCLCWSHLIYLWFTCSPRRSNCLAFQSLDFWEFLIKVFPEARHGYFFRSTFSLLW